MLILGRSSGGDRRALIRGSLSAGTTNLFHGHTHEQRRAGGERGVVARSTRARRGPDELGRAALLALRGGRRSSLWAGHVRHEPWPLREAKVLHIEDSLIAAAGLSVSGPPIAFASEHVAVEGFCAGADTYRRVTSDEW